MNQMEYQRELLSFDEKIRLAKLEEGKASVRVFELEYQKSRFALDIFNLNMQEQAKQAPPPEGPAPQAPAPQPQPESQ